MDFYSAFPQPKERIFESRLLKNSETVFTYKTLSDNLSNLIDYDFEKINISLEKIDVKRRLNPNLHTAVHRSINAYKANDADDALSTLKWIESNNPYQNDELIIRPPMHTYSDFISINHIHNEETQDVSGRKAEVYKTDEEEIKKFIPQINEVLELIKENDHLLYDEVTPIVSNIVLFKAQAIMGGSLSRSYGNIYIAIPNYDFVSQGGKEVDGVEYFMEHIVHETSHNLLFGIELKEKLVLNKLSDRFEAPLRSDPRPMYGIFHAAFVISRMVRIFRILESNGYKQYGKYIQHFEPRLQKALRVIKANGNLSNNGWYMLKTIEECGMG
ncbi:HEXXH motif-containing putative peptide modification protein [Acinetobacter sp. ACZLY 512]|uniref:aKG-HExxH-type peptide beta-hydroxylase n=1 Tax=Acinetobacter sp. ACZLY 512 TaxID=2911206 RepID=UPI002027014B|nr:HEXXH motif-containing putative peptide modification protein [Acinetobacter sp. ACZLY 512]MCL9677224.1 HEXXH motif-containing putative peptide modification protein [Acinetobacter sp. ACZLY 512]